MSTTDIARVNEAGSTEREKNVAINQALRSLKTLATTALLAANNLSDVANKTTSLDNLNAVAEASVASASTTNIGAAASSKVQITGTTPINAFDTVAFGIIRYVRFASALTLTHNATSLILQGVNITTAATARAIFMSLGSGNWILLAYTPATAPSFVSSITAGSGLSGGVITTSGAIALDVNSLTQDTAPDVAADYGPTYDASAAANKKVLLRQMGGLVYLTGGTVSNAATLDIVLTSYTAYRALKLVLHSFVPATDDVELWLRFSTDGGSSYDASGYNHAVLGLFDDGTVQNRPSASAAQILIAGGSSAALAVSNVAGEGGADSVVTIFGRTTARYTGCTFLSRLVAASGTATFSYVQVGQGAREAAQDTDAIRVLFESGNIASGAWSLYAYA